MSAHTFLFSLLLLLYITCRSQSCGLWDIQPSSITAGAKDQTSMFCGMGSIVNLSLYIYIHTYSSRAKGKETQNKPRKKKKKLALKLKPDSIDLDPVATRQAKGYIRKRAGESTRQRGAPLLGGSGDSEPNHTVVDINPA